MFVFESKSRYTYTVFLLMWMTLLSMEACGLPWSRTIRLQEALRHLGMAPGGQAGTRLGSELGISGRRDTMLRLVLRYEFPAAATPKRLG